MTYKSILAFVPSAAKARSICLCAATLAQDHGAHLTALTVTPEFVIPYTIGGEVPPQFLEAPEQVKRAEIDDIEKVCLDTARKCGAEVEFQHVGSTRSLVADVIIEYALSSDLVVMSQATGEEWGPWAELPDRVILNAGRPVLIVPENMTLDETPKTIVVAWSDTPQSARAVFDALPLLKRAKQVEVVSIKPAKSDKIERSLAVDQVALALARHGVNVTAATDSREHVTVAEAILEHARERHADALVMGCYGHSRFHEALLGGVSRMMLYEPSMPILMSH